MKLLAGILLAAATGLGILLWPGHQPLRILSVESDSMSPLIHRGDAVLVRPINPGDIQAGDIVSYVSPRDSSVIVTHRVVRVWPETGKLATKGDANLSTDTAFHSSRLIGSVGYTVPMLGWLIDALHTWQGLALVVYLPLTLLAGHELRLVVRHYRQPAYHLPGRRPNVI